MTAPSRPRRPAPRRLPRRVYWVRRLVLLAVLAVVVGTAYGVVGALGGAWSRFGAPDVAVPASAELTTETDGAAGTGAVEPSTGPSPTGPPTEAAEEAAEEAADRRAERRAGRDRLPAPDGVCTDADVLVQPRVPEARLGEPIRIVLEVSTRSTPACTWEVGPDSVFLKVTRLTEDSEAHVWSSQHCPGLVPAAQVVAREEKAAKVVLGWSGRMSDPECSRLAGWVREGSYRAVAVAGGAVTPLEEDFVIEAAVPEVVVEPSPLPTDEPDEGPDDRR